MELTFNKIGPKKDIDNTTSRQLEFDIGDMHSAAMDDKTRDSVAYLSPNLHIKLAPTNPDPAILTKVPPSETP